MAVQGGINLRIYIIRHGDPDYTHDTITEQGHLEAKALAKRLAREGLDELYCSPLGRAIATAQYTAEALQKELHIEEWTRELSDIPVKCGPYGTLCAFNQHGELIRKDLSYMTYDSWHKLPCFGSAPVQETFDMLKSSSDEFFKRHGYVREGGRYRIIKPNSSKIAVFCHGGFGITWLAHLLEIPLPLVWSGFWLPTTSVTTVLFDERTPEWAVPRCIGLGDTSHLYEAGLPVLPRGIVSNYY